MTSCSNPVSLFLHMPPSNSHLIPQSHLHGFPNNCKFPSYVINVTTSDASDVIELSDKIKELSRQRGAEVTSSRLERKFWLRSRKRRAGACVMTSALTDCSLFLRQLSERRRGVALNALVSIVCNSLF